MGFLRWSKIKDSVLSCSRFLPKLQSLLKQNRAISHPLSSIRHRDKALCVKKKNLCKAIDTEEKVGSTLERMAQGTTS